MTPTPMCKIYVFAWIPNPKGFRICFILLPSRPLNFFHSTMVNRVWAGAGAGVGHVGRKRDCVCSILASRLRHHLVVSFRSRLITAPRLPLTGVLTLRTQTVSLSLSIPPFLPPTLPLSLAQVAELWDSPSHGRR